MKYDMRLRLVQYARKHGIKPAARQFGCQVKTVRKWLRRYELDNGTRASLADRSRRPHNSPNRTPPQVEQQLIEARQTAPCFGSLRLVEAFDLPLGESAARRILRDHNLTARRKRKHQTKRDMRHVKAAYAFGRLIEIDVKYLTDIPYYMQFLLRANDLPRFQYTAREVKTGGIFLGYSNSISELHSKCFASAVIGHLRRHAPELSANATIQTDNGAEFGGTCPDTSRDGVFPAHIEAVLGLQHRFIPPGAKNHQSDVESLHDRIEQEFYDLEAYSDRQQFLEKAGLWQLWYNTVRSIRTRGNRSPDQILLSDHPHRHPHTWRLPAIDLDASIRKITLPKPLQKPIEGGYHVPPVPERRLNGRRPCAIRESGNRLKGLRACPLRWAMRGPFPPPGR